jgi:hypothetical protein
MSCEASNFQSDGGWQVPSNCVATWQLMIWLCCKDVAALVESLKNISHCLIWLTTHGSLNLNLHIAKLKLSVGKCLNLAKKNQNIASFIYWRRWDQKKLGVEDTKTRLYPIGHSKFVFVYSQEITHGSTNCGRVASSQPSAHTENQAKITKYGT